MSILITFPFDNAANYTFDTNEVEISSGVCALKDQRPVNSLSHASYSSDINLNWGGVLIGVATGGAGVSGGYLDLSFSDNRYVDYNALNNADSQQTGTIRTTIVPNYSGTPIALQVFVAISAADSDRRNHIAIFHKNTGQLAVQIRDFNDVVIVNVDLGLWSPVSGQEYEIEFNYDITTGEHRLFVNGTQFGATQTGTGTRDTNINLYRVGSSYTAAANSNFKVKEITSYSTVQHTADYTPGETIPETIYSTGNSKVVMNTTVRGDSLLTFSEVSTKAGLDEIKYNILQNSQPLWYDGLSFVPSNGTYAESNTAADISSILPQSSGQAVSYGLQFYMHSETGATTPINDTVTIGYDVAGAEKDDVFICEMYFDSTETDGDSGSVDVTVRLENEDAYYKDSTLVLQETYTLTPDATGRYTIKLVETVNMSKTKERKEQSYILTVNNRVFRFNVPEELTANVFENLA